MFEKNLNSTSRLIRILIGLGLITSAYISFTPKIYMIIFLFELIGFWILLSGALGWSPIYAMNDRSDFPTHLNKFSKKEMQEALK